MRLELPIFWNDDNDMVLKELGLDTKVLKEKETKNCIFYNIDSIYPYIVDGIEYTEIISGSKSVICALPFCDVDKLIQTNGK